MKFNDLGLIEPILRAIADVGYEEPSPIQEQAIRPVLEGHDMIGCAQTGTGKTAAFAMPILQRLHLAEAPSWRPTRALVLTPTRELALQICESFEAYGKYLPLRVTVVFGGVPQKPQEDALRPGVDILVATPGRLMDLVGQQLVDLSEVNTFVLDEADRMLDMGFLPDVRRVVACLPKQRQTLLFSATMPDEIAKLAQTILHDPVRVAVDPVSSTVDAIEQTLYLVARENKRALLAYLLKNQDIHSALVFVRTKHGADKVARDLTRDGVRADSIHGDKTQNARQYALTNFKQGRSRVLVATDIAARGIDIDELGFVINYDMPSPPENYVHRIGRTGRAGASGTAISFCDNSERPYLADIEKLIGKKIPVVTEHPYALQPSDGKSDGKGRRNDGRGKKNEPGAAQKQEPKAPQPAASKAEPKARNAEPKPDVRPKNAEPKPDVRQKNEPRPARQATQPEQAPPVEPAKPEPRQQRPAAQRTPPDRSGQRRAPQPAAPLARSAKLDASLSKGLPSIRDVAQRKAPRQSLEVQGYEELPKPAPGHVLLNSFADAETDYRLAEDPDVDTTVIESLGFYTPPPGAMRAIYGEEYDGDDRTFEIRQSDPPVQEPSAEPPANKRRRRPSGKREGQQEPAQPPEQAARPAKPEAKAADHAESNQPEQPEQPRGNHRPSKPRSEARPSAPKPENGQEHVQQSRPAHKQASRPKPEPAQKNTEPAPSSDEAEPASAAKRRRRPRRRPAAQEADGQTAARPAPAAAPAGLSSEAAAKRSSSRPRRPRKDRPKPVAEVADAGSIKTRSQQMWYGDSPGKK